MSEHAHQLPTGTVTFLFTDLAGSTRLWQQFPALLKPALARHDHLLREAVESHNGAIVKTTGDGLHAVFTSAADGLQAALHAQQAIGTEPWPVEIGSLHVRMGLHAGEGELRAGDYYGTAVNRAARIMSIAYGDHVLLSRTVAGLVQDHLSEEISLLDLGEHVLRDLSRPVHLFQLCHPDLPFDFPPLKSPAIAKHNLIAQLTSFVGRESELADVTHQLELSRLLTLLGPGGTGKTRLMLQVAEELIDKYPDGVWLVELAPLTEPNQLAERVAAPLQVQEQPGREMHDTLVDSLRRKELLLLLDNVEHLVRECAELAELLLTNCPKLKILVTGREALFIGGETTIQVPSLSLPETQENVTPDAIRNSEGVQLFLARAQAIRPDYDLSPTNAAPIGEIVRRLDGIPLALELAAARLRMLSAEQIADRLSDRFRLLTGGSRTALPRQQTLQSLIDWSWNLLEENERVLLRRLSVFSGGWSLEAAQAVTGFEPLDEFDILDNLEQLVNKSLITVKHHLADEARYGMLESIRQYGRDRLFAADEGEALRDRHADYFVEFALEAEPLLVGGDQIAWVRRLEFERDNLRAALQWAIENHDAELARRMAGALQPFWFARGHWSEGRRWLEESLAMDSGATVDQAVQAKALYRAGFLAFYQGDYARARMFCEQSLALYRSLDDKSGVVMTLVQLGRIGGLQDDQKAADVFLAEAAHLIEALPDSVEKAGAYSHLVVATGLFDQQISPESAHYIAESERLHRAFNNQAGLAVALTHQAFKAFMEGDYTLAAAHSDEAERLAMDLDDDRVTSRVLLGRVLLDVHEGDFDAARRRTEGILRQEDLLRQAGNRDYQHLSSGLIILAAILHKQGLAVWAARVFGLAEAWSQSSMEMAFLDQQFPLTRGLRAKVRVQLGDEAFATEIAAGQRMTMDDLLAIPHPPASAKDPGPAGDSLTRRENEVLRLLDQGLSNPQIAERLVISRRTVDAHLRSIYDKLDVKSRDAATRVAREQGLLDK